MTIPEHVRDEIREIVHRAADDVNWPALEQAQRSRQYDAWTRDENIGGRLGSYMAPRRVRVYLKDSIMRQYRSLSALSAKDYATRVGLKGEIVKEYEKPSGATTPDGVVCWGPARTWKTLLLSCFERASIRQLPPTGVVLHQSGGTYALAETRILIEEAAKRLKIQSLVWLSN